MGIQTPKEAGSFFLLKGLTDCLEDFKQSNLLSEKNKKVEEEENNFEKKIWILFTCK